MGHMFVISGWLTQENPKAIAHTYVWMKNEETLEIKKKLVGINVLEWLKSNICRNICDWDVQYHFSISETCNELQYVAFIDSIIRAQSFAPTSIIPTAPTCVWMYVFPWFLQQRFIHHFLFLKFRSINYFFRFL